MIRQGTGVDYIDKDGFYRHGNCDRIIMRVDDSANITGLYCYCRSCKKEFRVADIEHGKIANKIIKLKKREENDELLKKLL